MSGKLKVNESYRFASLQVKSQGKDKDLYIELPMSEEFTIINCKSSPHESSPIAVGI